MKDVIFLKRFVREADKIEHGICFTKKCLESICEQINEKIKYGHISDSLLKLRLENIAFKVISAYIEDDKLFVKVETLDGNTVPMKNAWALFDLEYKRPGHIKFEAFGYLEESVKYYDDHYGEVILVTKLDCWGVRLVAVPARP